MNPFQPNNQIQMVDDDSVPIDNDNNHCEMLSLQENDSMFYGFNVNQTLLNEQCSAGSSGPNAPPPSSCGTTTSDQSVNQSPGPIKRFRQIYGGGETTHSSPQSTFNKQRTPTMNWTENWMNTHYLYSKPSTSSTPSIISNGSAISQLSNLSVDTQLSVAVDFLNLELNLPQINEATNSSSSIENVDPCHFQQIKQCLAQILNKLTSIDEIQEFDGLRQLYKIAKDRQFIYCIEPTQISQIIQRLIEIVLRPNTKQRTKTLTMNLLSKITMAGNVCLNAIRSLETANRGIFLNAVIICLRPDSEEDDARFATNILSTLFTHPIVGEFFRRQARSQTIIRELMLALRQENYGFRHKFLRQIYHLIKPSRELKRFFHQSNGMQICLELFEKAVDEPMLHGCVALISLLIEGIEPALSQIPMDLPMDHFVRLKGIQILATRLDHGSPRLLQCIARCLALASDSNEIANQEIDHALRLSVQLIASTEGEMVKHLVGFIANVQSKHPAAKTFLQQNNAIPNLMFLLSVWVNSSPSLPSAAGHENEEKWKYLSVQRKGIDDLIDTILLALNNLSNGLNADANISCLAIMEHKNASSLFFQLLASSNRPEIIQIRTLYLLWRIFITLRHSIVDQFVNVSIREQQEEPKGYVHILLELFFGAIQRIYSSNGQKNENQQTTRKLASRSLLVLNEFVKYSPFLGQAASLIRASNWNLFALLRSLRDEELEIRFIEFLYHLSASSDLLAQWMFFYGDIINFTNIPHLSNYAVKIFNRFHHHNNNNASNIKL